LSFTIKLGVLQRSVKRPKLTPADRLLWAWLCAVWDDWKELIPTFSLQIESIADLTNNTRHLVAP